ncbi:hypothetical protein NG99_23235 [Erwinia typographi]|uniref:Uncharacterized protein n=1 Tax=Erwinia typographi TaxID=371042 RepID=A0A0A3ZP41_9GAMM|nr:hypothetical protein [Erwinia typographi]KGT87463.1 hypothetical protein NG99_23235 [Erwinia typographi]
MADYKSTLSTDSVTMTDDNVVEQIASFRTGSRFFANSMNDGYIAYFQKGDDMPDGIDTDAITTEAGTDINSEVTTTDQALLFCKWLSLFIDALPDDESIRFGPFFRMCDFRDYYATATATEASS